MYTLYSILKNIICIWATWLHRYSNKKMGTDDFHLATKASMHCNVYLLYQDTCLSLIFSIVFIVTKLSCTIQFTFAENAIFNTLPRGQINNLQKPYRNLTESLWKGTYNSYYSLFFQHYLILLFSIKFGYSEKATKFEKIFHLKFDITE